MTTLSAQIVATKDVAAVLADWAQALGLTAGIVALYRFSREKRLSRQAAARALYGEFMRDAVANPELYGGAWSDGTLTDARARQKYVYSIGGFLWAAEEILREFPANRVWRESLLVTIREHADYFGSAQFEGEQAGYSAKLLRLINKGCEDAQA